jgi:hypothetical protein
MCYYGILMLIYNKCKGQLPQGEEALIKKKKWKRKEKSKRTEPTPFKI